MPKFNNFQNIIKNLDPNELIPGQTLNRDSPKKKINIKDLQAKSVLVNTNAVTPTDLNEANYNSTKKEKLEPRNLFQSSANSKKRSNN